MIRSIVLVTLSFISPLVLSASDAEIIQQAEAQFKLEHYKEAFEIIAPLAKAGSAEAEGKLGALYSWGAGVKRDPDKGLALLQSAANKNYARAQHALCSMYASGSGVQKDMKQAFSWCERAAKGGNMLAMTDLGLFYMRGDSVAQSSKLAYQYWDRASNLGDPRASENIASMLDNGDLNGVKDPMGAVARRMTAALSKDNFCPNIEWPCPDEDPLEKCNVAVLKTKIEGGANINEKAKIGGHTALHCAAVRNNADLAKLVLANGSIVDAKNPNGVTPLHLAAQFGSLEVSSILLSNGAQINATTNLMATPLHAAVLSMDERVVTLLLDKGADVNAVGDRGMSPLDVALRPRRNNVGAVNMPNQKIVDLIKSRGGKCLSGQC